MTEDPDTPVDAECCFTVYNGRVHAVLNWSQRRSLSDAIISRPLTDEELAVYKEEREHQRSETEIFKTLFPPRLYQVLNSEELRSLQKTQVVDLILKRLQCPLPSLGRMTKEDLCVLYEHLGHSNFQLVLRNPDQED